jgi:hypothetical protein
VVFKYNTSLMVVVVTHNYIDGVQTHRFNLSDENKNEISLPIQKVYTLGTVPIKKAKLDDIGKLPVEHQSWYETLQNWPSGERENEEEEQF